MRTLSERVATKPSPGAWALALVFLVLSASTSTTAAPVLQPRPISTEAYGESYTAIAHMTDGTYLLIQYVFTNAGWGDGKAACRILHVPTGSKGNNEAARFDKDQWSYSASGNQLKVGSCYLKSSSKETVFHAETKSMSATLKLSAPSIATRAPGHKVTVDDDEFYQSEILIPWTTADAEIKNAAGKKTVTGHGYLDHSRSNTRLPKVAQQWVRFRGFVGADQVLVEYKKDAEGRSTGWVWKKSVGHPKAISQGEYQVKKMGSGLKLSMAIGTIDTQKRLYAYRPAKEWGLLGKMAKPWVGDPITTTYAATLVDKNGTSISGILEHVKITD
ncbi:MAG: hypothetical protein CMH52_06815 [Myxococcales bacterium]|nr:hypothetical protein [Myxococcales bacterium]